MVEEISKMKNISAEALAFQGFDLPVGEAMDINWEGSGMTWQNVAKSVTYYSAGKLAFADSTGVIVQETKDDSFLVKTDKGSVEKTIEIDLVLEWLNNKLREVLANRSMEVN